MTSQLWKIPNRIKEMTVRFLWVLKGTSDPILLFGLYMAISSSQRIAVFVNFVLSNPVDEGFRHAADLGGNGLHGGPKCWGRASVFEHHANRTFAHLG